MKTKALLEVLRFISLGPIKISKGMCINLIKFTAEIKSLASVQFLQKAQFQLGKNISHWKPFKYHPLLIAGFM